MQVRQSPVRLARRRRSAHGRRFVDFAEPASSRDQVASEGGTDVSAKSGGLITVSIRSYLGTTGAFIRALR
jgi:hypothetical protein